MLTVLLAAATVMSTPVHKCELPRSERATRNEPVRAHRLGEMAPGKQMLGIFNSVDGCPKPIVVREEVGQPRR